MRVSCIFGVVLEVILGVMVRILKFVDYFYFKYMREGECELYGVNFFVYIWGVLRVVREVRIVAYVFELFIVSDIAIEGDVFGNIFCCVVRIR